MNNKKTVKRESWFHILRLRTISGKIFYILLFGLFIRLLLLFLTPFVVCTDGVIYLRIAESILSGNIQEAMATLNMSHMIYHPLYPLLIKIISFPFPVGSLELSGRIVSILASLLLALPVFLLARRFYGDKVGYISTLLVVVYPFLVYRSLFVHTEVTLTFFAMVGVWCIWLALEGRLLWSFVAGIIFGLAYLTRPEGLIYVLLAVVIILLLSYFRESKRVSKYTFIKVFLLLLGFAIMASPYLIYLRKDYGRWLISGYIPFYGSAGVLSQLPHLSSFPQLSSLKGIMAYTAQAWYKDYTRSFSEAFYPIMLILAGLGFLGSPWDRKRTERNIFLALFLIPPLLTAFLRESSPRRFICVIPILVIWAANGVTVLQNWLHNSVEAANFEKDSWIRRLLLKKWVALAVLLLSLAPMILLPVVGNALNEIPIYAVEFKAVGLWMKEHLPHESVVMASKPHVYFYANMKGIEMRRMTYEEVMQTAQVAKADYLIVDQRNASELTPDIAFLLEPEQNEHKGLEVVYVYDKIPGCKVIVYKFFADKKEFSQN